MIFDLVKELFHRVDSMTNEKGIAAFDGIVCNIVNIQLPLNMDVHKTLTTRPRSDRDVPFFKLSRPRRDRDIQPSRPRRDIFSNSRDPDETFHFRDRDVFETIKFVNY